MNWLAHITGIDNLSGPWYGFWSGIAGDLGLVGAAYALLRKHNCHQRWCWRIGRHRHGSWLLCNRHHPIGAPSGADVANDGTDRATELLGQVVAELRGVKSAIQRGGFGLPDARVDQGDGE